MVTDVQQEDRRRIFLTHESFFSVLQLIPQISSLTPITTLLPLVGVLSLTALKDGYDEVVSAPNLVKLYKNPLLASWTPGYCESL